MDNDRFARTIKNARLKKGYTQSQLADLLNVSNKTISKWETGFPNKKILRNSPCLPACKQKNIATRLRDTT